MFNNSLRKVCLAVATLFSCAALTFGQGQVRTITGIVVDQNNDPLIGAGVVVEGQATIGTVTDFDGNYSLTVPANATHLRFSYIGMVDQVVEIAGKTVINISLVEDATVLEGVVVTALGIKRSEKAVTYNVQKLDEKVFVTREANMVNSLAGKLAGVQINETSAGAGSETKVVMRGAKSIANSNNALYVLDGIPLPTLSITKPGDSWDIFADAQRSGDGMAMLNSEDVADMSALVGPSAAALYGYKAANGILMLTSRTGEKGLRVSYSNSTTFSNPFMLPRLQNSYGAKLGQYSSWGTKMNVPQAWSINDFFQTGVNQSHTLALSLGGDNYSTYVSAGWNGANGIIPNNKYGRYNLTLRQTVDFLNGKMHLSLLGMYIKVDEQNMLSGGLYHNPLVPLYLMSPSDNLYSYAVYERYDPTRNFPVQYWSATELSMQNPFWMVNRNLYNTAKNRFLAGASLSYDITDWMDIQGRVRTDVNGTVAEQRFYASSNGLFAGPYGRYYYDDQKTTQTYADVLLNIHKTFGDNLIQLNGVLGASIEDYFYRGTSVAGDLLGVANLFTFANMDTGKAFAKDTFRDQVQSVFATAQLGFKNMVFLDVTARNDWASQLTSPNGKVTPIFYPSVGLSAILTDIFKVDSDFLTYAKIRGSYAEVGNPINRFITISTYPVTAGVPVTNTWAAADNFRPERTKSWEAGLDLRLFKSKLQVNATYYQSSTYDQVFTPVIPGSSTNSTLYVNAGRIDNRGVELAVQFTQPLGPVEWQTNFIYTRNINKIVKLLDAEYNGTRIRSTSLSVGGSTGAKFWLTEGGSVGDIYVSGLKTDEHGFIWTSPTGAGVTPAVNDGTPATMMYAGNVQPVWTGSWRNQFSWKGITASALITARVGGVGVSLTEATLDAYGMSQRSAIARDEGGVALNTVGATGNQVNLLRTGAQQYYQTISGGNGSDALGAYYVYSMTNVRLAEVSLGFDIPVKKAIPWIEGLNIAAVGRNLAMIYCKAPFDPEQVANAGNYGGGIDYFMMPSTRNIGFSAKITFGGGPKKEAAPAPQVIEKEIIKEIVKEVVKEVPVEVVKEVPAKTLQGIYNDDLYFVIGKADIRPDEAFKLGKIAQIMKDNPDATIEITGSADSNTGAARTNARLSEKRAQTVVNMLAKDGIPASRISYKAAVDSKPGQGAAANRVAICIVK